MSVQNPTIGDGVVATRFEQPATVEELQGLVKALAAEGGAIYPRGGETSLEYGGIPRVPGVAVSTLGLNRVIDYPAADMTITVEAGVTMGELARVLDAEGQRLTIDPPRADRATIGGVYATNASGPRRFGVGRPRDQILGVSFVTSDGEVVKGGGRVVKNVAGYDFPRLITGSMGTLGVIAQLTLKVRPKPEASALVWVGLSDSDQLAEALNRLNLSETRPIAIEAYNSPAAETVGRGLGLPPSTWILAVGFEDNHASVAWQVEKLRTECAGRPTEVRTGDEAAALWTAMVEYPGGDGATLSFQANLPPSAAAPFAASVDPGLWAVQAHGGSGVVRGFARSEFDPKTAETEITRLRTIAAGVSGSLTLPHCPTAWKPELRVWGDPRPEWVWCERLKKTLDPVGALNPGRFVGGV